MRRSGMLLVVATLAALAGSRAAAAECPCRGGGGTTFDDRACGPRVWGPAHEPVGPADQCDGCVRFHGCNGYRQLPEMLAPWQLPPGRGFRPPEAFGYRPGPCVDCGPPGGWLRHR